MTSQNLPATTSLTIPLSRSISPFADSSHASQPQLGKSSLYHLPNRTWRPGKVENTTVIGAASGSKWLSLTCGRARSSPRSSSGSRPYPSVRSTSKWFSSRPIISSMAECNGRKRSALVTRLYAGSGGGPAFPSLAYPNRPSISRRSLFYSTPHRTTVHAGRADATEVARQEATAPRSASADEHPAVLPCQMPAVMTTIPSSARPVVAARAPSQVGDQRPCVPSGRRPRVASLGCQRAGDRNTRRLLRASLTAREDLTAPSLLPPDFPNPAL